MASEALSSYTSLVSQGISFINNTCVSHTQFGVWVVYDRGTGGVKESHYRSYVPIPLLRHIIFRFSLFCTSILPSLKKARTQSSSSQISSHLIICSNATSFTKHPLATYGEVVHVSATLLEIV